MDNNRAIAPPGSSSTSVRWHDWRGMVERGIHIRSMTIGAMDKRGDNDTDQTSRIESLRNC
jgi:hypothetical protein